MKVLADSTPTSKEQLMVPRIVRPVPGVQSGDSPVRTPVESGDVIVQVGRPHVLAEIRAAVRAAGPPTRKLVPRRSVMEMKIGIAKHLRKKHTGGQKP